MLDRLLLGIFAGWCCLAGCAKSSAAPPANAAKSPAAKARAPQAAGQAANHAGARPSKHRALLVGCTKYDHLDQNDLEGPANDVRLFRSLLVDHFEFKDAPITILADIPEAKGRPTRANIAAAFKELIDQAQPGEDVVILLGGHGFYLPDVNPNENDPEPDGLDECFLPCDTQPFNASSETIGNAIRDDELSAWITAIRDKGAFVWAIIDSCHSGTGGRNAFEIARRITPEKLGIPKEVDQEWRNRGERSRGGKIKEHLVDAPRKSGQGEWIAMYGAQSTETAPEMMLPKDVPYKDQQYHGLLTFMIRKVLTQANTKLNYGELMQAIQQEYNALRGSKGPTPLAEGSALDRAVLGDHEWPGRTKVEVVRRDDGLYLTGGTIHGVRKGMVLAVFKQVPGDDSVPDGYVKIDECFPLESVVSPCSENGTPIRSLATGFVRIARPDYSFLSALNVGIDPLDDKTDAAQLSQSIQAAGAQSGEMPPGLVKLQVGRENADWLIVSQNRQLYLTPPSGWGDEPKIRSAGPAIAVPGPEYGPFPADDVSGVVSALGKVAKAQSLLRLVPSSQSSGSRRVNVLFELRRHADFEDLTGTAIELGSGPPIIENGETIGVHLKNNSRKQVDVTLLYVDAAYGINAWFPEPGNVDHRIEAGKSVGPPAIRRIRINGETTSGMEHIVMIACEAKGPPANYTWLAQGSLTPRGSSSTPDLDDILAFAAFRSPMRGPPRSAEDGGTAFTVKSVSFRVQPVFARQ
jgi:hypothetical protein